MVFNASSHGKNELSLNDGLMLGPAIQRDSLDILIAMRSYCYVICADIKQMYRMIWVADNDRDMQRILWRVTPSAPIFEYRLNTVTYSTKPASFIAIKCLEVITDNLQKSNPAAAFVIKNCFYVDDLITGGDSFGEVLSLQKAIHDALAEKGFHLRKYLFNSKEVLSKIPVDLLADCTSLSFENKESIISILGITWNPATDCYGIRVAIELLPVEMVPTKRIILSYISRVFDPLGLVSPVTVCGKLLLQSV